MNFEQKSGDFSSYEITDYLTARDVYSSWQIKEGQDLDDWLMRQRKAELNALVKKVIKNEFSKEDKLLIDLRWYKGLSCDEIAKRMSMSRSKVYRKLQKINDTLFDKLKYALEYRFGIKNQSAFMLIECDVKSTGKYEDMFPIAQRLRKLRYDAQVGFANACYKTGISQERMAVIEKYGGDLTASELKKLGDFYKVSCDYILFGKTRCVRDPYTGYPLTYKC